MQRIPRVDPAQASPGAQELLAVVESTMGQVPNILATLACSSAALGGYLGLANALGGGRLPGSVREQIALACAGANQCDYCASAHTALGGMQGLEEAEIRRNLTGKSGDSEVQAVLDFTRRVIETRGRVADEDLDAIRAAGYSDEAIVEIFANVVLNLFTNYFNHLADTAIDFPVVRTALAA